VVKRKDTRRSLEMDDLSDDGIEKDKSRQYLHDWIIWNTRRLGFFCVMAIQLIGPPLIFYQYFTGQSMEDADKINWTEFQNNFPSLSDWGGDDHWGRTKALGLVFLFCFILNSLFCWIDEAKTLEKIFRIYELLSNPPFRMVGTSEFMLRFSAFINAWVLIWLCVDLYLAMVTVDTAQYVLMDALGLSFLYNLDDIAGYFGFVDEDDWPGVQLAWFIGEFDRLHVADAFGEIDDYRTEESWMHTFNSCITALIVCMAIGFPLLYIFTPWQQMKADPFFENIHTKEQFIEMVKNVTNGLALEI